MSGLTKVDPITIEVVHGHLVNIVREMRSIIWRSSFTPTLCESVDFACGIVSRDGELVAMSEDVPLHIIAVAWHLKLARQLYGDSMDPRDIYLSNDPYTSGPHLNDMLHLRPFFHGGKLPLMVAARVHWVDVGGRTHGSLTGEAREIYEEGIRVPMARIFDRGTFNADLFETIMANVRNPEMRKGDFEATIGALNVAEQRLQWLYDKYSYEVMEACIAANLDRSERVIRDAISRLPDGVYFAEEYLENDGVHSGKPVPLRCTLTIGGDEMTFDFTGSSPELAGPMNGGPSMAYSGVFVVLKSYLDPATPVNSGLMRAVNVISPEGTFINASRPTPVGGYAEVGLLVQSLVTGLLGQLMPGLVGGPGYSTANHCFLSGSQHDSRQLWIWYEYPKGGTPASPMHDGNNVTIAYNEGDLNCVLPVEATERDGPVLLLRNELRGDSGGPGYRRGGLGLVKEILVEDPNGCSLSLLGDEAIIPRLGMCEGYPGALNEFRIRRDDKEFIPGEIPSKVANYPLKTGDVLVVRLWGGCGFGDPLDRELERVKGDFDLGYVSEGQARDAYGVVFRSGEIDAEATGILRQKKRSERKHCIVKSVDADDHDSDGRRRCPLTLEMAHQLGIEDGDIVEYVPGKVTHLKAWARIDPSLSGSVTPLGPHGRAMLQVKDGERIWVRPLRPPIVGG